MVQSKTSAAQYAYENMKEWILSGFLVPGKKIDQDEAAERLGLSRMPIRSALDRLAADGLAVVTPNHGAIVVPLNDVKLNQLFDARAQIEAMTVIQTTKKASNQAFDKLFSMVYYQRDFPNLSTSTVLEQNKSFHRYIAQISGDEVLLQIFDNLWEQSERYRRVYFRTPHSNDRVLDEHLQIVNLMASRKPQEAADYMVEHTRASQRAILAAMEKPIPPAYCRIVVTEEK